MVLIKAPLFHRGPRVIFTPPFTPATCAVLEMPFQPTASTTRCIPSSKVSAFGYYLSAAVTQTFPQRLTSWRGAGPSYDCQPAKFFPNYVDYMGHRLIISR